MCSFHLLWPHNTNALRLCPCTEIPHKSSKLWLKMCLIFLCFPIRSRHPYLQGVQDISEAIAMRSSYLPFLFDPIFELSPTGSKHRKAVKQVHDFTQGVIKSRRAARTAKQTENSNKKYMDFLDILLNAKVCCSYNTTRLTMKRSVPFLSHLLLKGRSLNIVILSNPERNREEKENKSRKSSGRRKVYVQTGIRHKGTEWFRYRIKK